MIDHIGLPVSDIEASRAFYSAALAPLGMTMMEDHGPDQTDGRGHVVLFGGDEPELAVTTIGPAASGVHLAFTAPDRATVDAFHRAALGAGGRDNGAPGLRPQYHPNYYGAFVFDPDGNNIEAVCHKPEGAA